MGLTEKGVFVMALNNQIYDSIYRKLVLPSLNKIQGTVDGYVIKVDYTKLLCEVAYIGDGSHSLRTMKNVKLPKEADGIFSQAVKNGDRVTVSFKNKSMESPYVSTVYKGDHSRRKYLSPYGARSIRQSRIF